ncbi:App1 family protein [uncultured Aureimonas sp.]|uniref:App1 family protein n=1 Tax=uncultured Aureimonas sp. TaxID=1604662 RepID=UPI0025F3EE26|nr:phosphatase domain-containing protein [uncultured Aureimonas sp.]
MGVGNVARQGIGAVAGIWDDARYHAKLRLGLVSPPILLPYRGYASGGRVRFGGRGVEDEGVVGAERSRSRWTQLWRTFRRYETDEIRDAVVEWRVGDVRGTAVTDKQGFFAIETAVDTASVEGPWLTAELILRSAPGFRFEPMRRELFVRVVGTDAEFGIVSDLDDTLVETGAQNFLKHLRTVAPNSAEGRVAFPGVAFLFRALASGRTGPNTNPVFYVSSSPWNLHELFEDFMELRGIPHGPMFLKDFGLNKTQWLTGSHRTHKLAAIDRILDAYPGRFVLVGDTGQSDAAIYAETVRTHSGRILAVYLRDVSPGGFRSGVREAMEAIGAAGVSVTTGQTLEPAARHAEDAGLVPSGTVDRMADEVARDFERRAPRPGFA